MWVAHYSSCSSSNGGRVTGIGGYICTSGDLKLYEAAECQFTLVPDQIERDIVLKFWLLGIT